MMIWPGRHARTRHHHEQRKRAWYSVNGWVTQPQTRADQRICWPARDDRGMRRDPLLRSRTTWPWPPRIPRRSGRPADADPPAGSAGRSWARTRPAPGPAAVAAAGNTAVAAAAGTAAAAADTAAAAAAADTGLAPPAAVPER